MFPVAGMKSQVKADSKKTPRKQTAEHLPKKSSRTLSCDVSGSVETSRATVDGRKSRTDTTTSLSVDTSKVSFLP